jgi:hypothetical protein
MTFGGGSPQLKPSSVKISSDSGEKKFLVYCIFTLQLSSRVAYCDMILILIYRVDAPQEFHRYLC